MLAYAACHCSGNYHAHQLRQGGELLTRVASDGTFWFNRAVPNISGSCKSPPSSGLTRGSTRMLLQIKKLLLLCLFQFLKIVFRDTIVWTSKNNPHDLMTS